MSRTRRSIASSATAQSAGGLTEPRLLPFLLNPQSYPHHPRQVRLIQTHSALVFLAGAFVYKVKKPVNFGFLDFSTLERRKAMCERELLLNQRLSSGVYLEVVPISSSGGGLVLGPGDHVVEYAVKMRYLSPRNLLDQLVQRNAVTGRDLDRLARHLSRFYSAQHPTPAVETWGQRGRLQLSTTENFEQTRSFVGQTLTHSTWVAIAAYTNGFLRAASGLFARRVREKRIRDCHGDLHLEHIHLTPRALQIYDCIEFNDRFRYVDVASDVAFLAMDLDYVGRPDLSRRFVRRMSQLQRDPDLLRLLDFYKCYRAYVRGKVESLHSVARLAPEEERREAAGRAERYFRLALRYAMAGSGPRVVVVMGRIGSGKSTLARALGVELGWPVLSSDQVRKELAGFPLFVRTEAAARRRLYSRAMTERTYAALRGTAVRAARVGTPLLLDATFGDRAQRRILRKVLQALGVPVVFVEAHATDREVRRRLRARDRQTTEISDARLEDFVALSGRYQPPIELSREICVRVSTEGKIETVVAKALCALVRPG